MIIYLIKDSDILKMVGSILLLKIRAESVSLLQRLNMPDEVIEAIHINGFLVVSSTGDYSPEIIIPLRTAIATTLDGWTE